MVKTPHQALNNDLRNALSVVQVHSLGTYVTNGLLAISQLRNAFALLHRNISITEVQITRAVMYNYHENLQQHF